MSGIFENLLTKLGKKKKSEIQQEIETFVDSAKEYMEHYKKNIDEIRQQKKILELMSHHLGGLVWIKRWDSDTKSYIYEFANRTHCDVFFKFEPHCLIDCTSHVKGYSDIDILNDYRERTGKQHSFGELCVSTDVHATMQAIQHYDTEGNAGATTCRYIECGMIDEKPMVLDVVKTPLFDPNYPCKCWGSHTYTVGNAFDVTASCETKLQHVQSLVEQGHAEKLQPGVYWVYPKAESCSLLKKEFDV